MNYMFVSIYFLVCIFVFDERKNCHVFFFFLSVLLFYIPFSHENSNSICARNNFFLAHFRAVWIKSELIQQFTSALARFKCAKCDTKFSITLIGLHRYSSTRSCSNNHLNKRSVRENERDRCTAHFTSTRSERYNKQTNK